MPELVIVFLESSDKQNWAPIPREEIPEWLRTEEYIEYMIGGGALRNTHQDAELKAMKWYTATAADTLNIKPSVILLPPSHAQFHH